MRWSELERNYVGVVSDLLMSTRINVFLALVLALLLSALVSQTEATYANQQCCCCARLSSAEPDGVAMPTMEGLSEQMADYLHLPSQSAMFL